jgi:hypothetical protein
MLDMLDTYGISLNFQLISDIRHSNLRMSMSIWTQIWTNLKKNFFSDYIVC